MVLAAPVHSVLTFFCSKAPGISATALAPAGLLTAILCGVGLKRLCPDRHGHLRSAALFLVIAWLAYLPFFAGRSVFQNAYLWERAHYIPNAMLAVALTLVGAAFFRGQSRALAAVLAGVVLSANAWRTAEKVNRIRLDSEKFRTDTVALCRALETEAHQKGIIYRPDGEYRTAETRLSGTWVRLSQSAVVYCGWHRCGGDCAESGDGVVKVFKKEPPLGPKSLSAPHEEETKPVAMGKH